VLRGKPEDEAAVETSPARCTEDERYDGRTLHLRGLTGEPWYVPLNGIRTRFGRGSDCQVVLGGAEASRHHAEIARIGPVYVVRDLGSRNGTFLNGKRVSEAPFDAGSLLRMGDWLGYARPGLGCADEGFAMQGLDLWGGPVLRDAVAPARATAASTLPIIIEGETGTGKELVARAIHAWSGRSGPLVAVNCAALPESLAEGELFGYRRGAFTGAERASAGYFRAAHEGTLLLDEICDLPLALQVKLLRVLEQREVTPLGESTPVAVDVRVLAAAQEPLHAAVARKCFRADLYARLDGLTVRLPPLRERIEDIAGLLARFVAEQRPHAELQLTTNARETLYLYDWPFNVRELRSLAQRLALLSTEGGLVHRSDLPERMRSRATSPASDAPAQEGSASELTRFVAALREHEGNVTKAARAAKISRMRAYRLLRANPRIDVASFRPHKEGE
jgi:hypothetical protein